MEHMTIYEKQRGSLAFIGLILLAVILVFIAWWMRSPNFPLKQGSSDQATDAERIQAGVKYRIEITDKGFVPGVLTIEPYDSVAFVNRDTVPHFPVPGDLSGKGGCEEFGQGRELRPNEGYAVVFFTEGTCAFSDSLNQDFSAGTIFIQTNR